MRPVEGTILTVVREAAEAAAPRRRGRRRRSSTCSTRPGRRAADALERTPELLPVLHEAGVVDAGGHGLPAAARRAARTSSTAGRSPSPTVGRRRRPRRGARRTRGHGDGDVADLRYEVMYFLEAPDETIAGVQGRVGRHRRLDRGRRRRRHLELPHPHRRHRRRDRGRASTCGRPRKIRVTDLLEQVEEERWVREAPPRRAVDEPPHAPSRSPPRWSRSATGDGVRRIFHSPRRAAGRRRRAVDEPVDRADPRGGRGVPGRRGRRPAEQQEHRPGGRAGRRADRPRPCGSCPTHGHHRGLRRAGGLRPRGRRPTPTPTRWPRRRRTWCAGEVTRAVRDSTVRRRADRARATGSASPATASRPSTPTWPATRRRAARPRWSTTTTRSSPSSRARARRRGDDPPHHRVARRAPSRRRGRGPPRRPAAVPVPLRHRVAAAPMTQALRQLDELAGHRARRVSGPKRAEGAAAELGDRDGARPAHALPPPLPRPHQRGRASPTSRSARRRWCSVEVQRRRRRAGHRGTGHGRRRRHRRHRSPADHVLQPGVAGAAAAAGHRGRVLRQARARSGASGR